MLDIKEFDEFAPKLTEEYLKRGGKFQVVSPSKDMPAVQVMGYRTDLRRVEYPSQALLDEEAKNSWKLIVDGLFFNYKAHQGISFSDMLRFPDGVDFARMYCGGARMIPIRILRSYDVVTDLSLYSIDVGIMIAQKA